MLVNCYDACRLIGANRPEQVNGIMGELERRWAAYAAWMRDAVAIVDAEARHAAAPIRAEREARKAAIQAEYDAATIRYREAMTALAMES